MTDKFGNKVEVGDYVARSTSDRDYHHDVLYRIAHIDEAKDRVCIIPVMGWMSERFSYEEAIKDPVAYTKAHYGCYQPTHKTIVKTYKPDTL